MQVIVEFNVQLNYQDYWELKNADNMHVIWTHYQAMEWLDLLDTTSLVTEEYLPSLMVYLVRCMYRIDEATLDMLLLKYPKILEPVRDYERTKISFESIKDK